MSYSVPVSVKGIVFEESRVWLRLNERKEWELPGGKIDEGEELEEALIREIREEMGFEVEIIKLIDVDLHKIKSSPDEAHGVLIICYLCRILKKNGKFELQGEAGPAEFKSFPIKDIVNLNMPKYYKRAILKRRKIV